jgi:hypothetical protein
MLKVFGSTDLGGRVTLEGEQGVIRIHSAAIVRHPHQAAAANGKLDLDAAGVGVETVLDQLLDNRCGTFDDLTSGNAVDQGIGEDSNSRHGGHHTRPSHPPTQ